MEDISIRFFFYACTSEILADRRFIDLAVDALN